MATRAKGLARHRQESAPALAQLTMSGSKGSTLVSVDSWEVTAPPPITSVKGALVPRVLSGRRRRKISIEVHRVDNVDHRGKNLGSYEVCIVRVLNPVTSGSTRDLSPRSGGVSKRNLRQTTTHYRAKSAPRMTTIRDDEGSNGHHRDDDDYEDDDDESTVAHPSMMDGFSSLFEKPNFEGWTEKYRLPIRNIAIKGTARTGVFIQITLGRIKQTRQLIFDTIEEAEEFRTTVRQQLDLEEDRNDEKLRVVFQGKDIPPKEEITFLVEVVSGWDLPAGDIGNSSDPFVIVSFNGRDVHKTQRIDNTLDPIWTVKTGSLFLFKIDPESLFLSEGLLFTVKDYDTIGANERLGIFYVAPSVIYESNGERLEYKLLPPLASKHKQVPGHVAIRCRRASKYDQQFMQEHVYKNLKQGGLNQMDATTDQAGGVNAISSYFTRQKRYIKIGNQEIKQYKVRPGPDPRREEQTTWLTKKEIDAESMKESHHWIDVGSGRLGRLHVEILGCDDLPNLDTGGRNKTDTFVALVYEDAMVKTDVVDDCLNPRWLPWSKRAVVFHVHHSSSQLHLGVFDYDQSIHPADDHDLVGRISVDLTNLRRDTMYILKYDIYTTSRLSDRKKKGSITIRLRLEIEDERQVLLSNLEPPPEFYVNVKTRKDFRVVNYTCTGKYDTSKYDIKYINSYIEEILSTQHAMFYLNDAFMRLLLWRGTFPIRFGNKTYHFAVHSLAAFVSLAFVVERPQLFPAWFFGAMGWIMLATMDFRLHTPDPWLHCKDFGEFVATLVTGSSPHPPDSIDENENAKEAKEFRDRMQKRIAAAEEAAAKEYEENLRAQEEFEREMEEIGETNTDISTNRSGGFSVDPFKAVLFPVQQNLAMVCRYMRHARWIIAWEEVYISFWFTSGCFMISIVFLFVPWFFILKWSSRIIVWTLFGPWMRLVDIFYVSKIKTLTEDELTMKKEKQREKRRLATEEALSQARIKREKANKLKAMKTYMFGRYISKIPVLKEDRFKDVPLPESSAVPYKPPPRPLSEIAMQEAGYHRTRLPGQHLVGDMIPRMETVGFTDAPIGQPIKQRDQVDPAAPAGIIGGGPESTTQAYIKIGSLVIISSTISWFAVPFFSALIDRFLSSLQAT